MVKSFRYTKKKQEEEEEKKEKKNKKQRKQNFVPFRHQPAFLFNYTPVDILVWPLE